MTSVPAATVIDTGADSTVTNGQQLAASFNRLAPTSPRASDHEIFANYSSNGHGTWANTWTRSLDFSGVAWNTPYGS